MLKDAAAGSRWTGASSMLGMCVTVLFAGLSIRFMGAAKAGFLQTINSLLFISTTIGGLGYGYSAIRAMSAARGNSDAARYREVFQSYLFIGLSVGVICFSLILLSREKIVAWADFAYDAEFEHYLYTVGIGLMLGQFNVVFKDTLNSALKFNYVAMTTLFMQVTPNLVGIFLLPHYPRLDVYGGIMATCSAICTTMYLIFLRKSGIKIPLPAFNFRVTAPLVKQSFPVYTSNLMGTFAQGWDKVVLVSFFGAAVVPIYQIPRRFYEQIHAMVNNSYGFILPLFSNATDKELIRTTKRGIEWGSWALAGTAYAIVILGGPILVRILVKSEFAGQTFPYILMFSGIGFIHAFTVVPYLAAYAAGETRSNFWLNVSYPILVIPMMYLGGMLGKLWLTICGQLGIVISVWWYFSLLAKRTDEEGFGMKLWRARYILIYLGFGALWSVFAHFYLHDYLWVQMIAAAVVIGAFIPVSVAIQIRVVGDDTFVPYLLKIVGRGKIGGFATKYMFLLLGGREPRLA